MAKSTGLEPRSLSRREMVGAALALPAGSGLGALVGRPAAAQDADWKRFKGKELYVLLWRNPWTEEIVKHVREFEGLTGMTVSLEVLPELQARQKLTLEMTSGGGGIDVFLSSMHVEKRRYWKAGYYEPLNRYLDNKALLASDYEWNDFVATARDFVTQPDGSISALPCLVTTFMLAYRQDLFEQKGLTPPRTMAEFEAAARALHDPPRVYGFVSRGLKNANAMSFGPVLFAMGGKYLTAQGASALDTPPWPKAVDWYASMLRQFGPPGVVNFNWYESSSAFLQGQAAMILDGNDILTQLEDPQKSKVVGKVGYVPFPAGPAGSHGNLVVTGLAVSAQSRNKEAAFLFTQWATNKQNAVRELTVGNDAGRTSARAAPEVKAKQRMPAPFYTAFAEALRTAEVALPEIVDVTQYRDIIGVAIQKTIEGAKADAAVAEAHKEFQALLDRTER